MLSETVFLCWNLNFICICYQRHKSEHHGYSRDNTWLYAIYMENKFCSNLHLKVIKHNSRESIQKFHGTPILKLVKDGTSCRHPLLILPNYARYVRTVSTNIISALWPRVNIFCRRYLTILVMQENVTYMIHSFLKDRFEWLLTQTKRHELVTVTILILVVWDGASRKKYLLLHMFISVSLFVMSLIPL